MYILIGNETKTVNTSRVGNQLSLTYATDSGADEVYELFSGLHTVTIYYDGGSKYGTFTNLGVIGVTRNYERNTVTVMLSTSKISDDTADTLNGLLRQQAALIEDQQNVNDAQAATIQALRQENEALTECILEISEIVYA